MISLLDLIFEYNPISVILKMCSVDVTAGNNWLMPVACVEAITYVAHSNFLIRSPTLTIELASSPPFLMVGGRHKGEVTEKARGRGNLLAKHFRRRPKN